MQFSTFFDAATANNHVVLVAVVVVWVFTHLLRPHLPYPPPFSLLLAITDVLFCSLASIFITYCNTWLEFCCRKQFIVVGWFCFFFYCFVFCFLVSASCNMKRLLCVHVLLQRRSLRCEIFACPPDTARKRQRGKRNQILLKIKYNYWSNCFYCAAR